MIANRILLPAALTVCVGLMVGACNEEKKADAPAADKPAAATAVDAAKDASADVAAKVETAKEAVKDAASAAAVKVEAAKEAVKDAASDAATKVEAAADAAKTAVTAKVEAAGEVVEEAAANVADKAVAAKDAVVDAAKDAAATVEAAKPAEAPAATPAAAAPAAEAPAKVAEAAPEAKPAEAAPAAATPAPAAAASPENADVQAKAKELGLEFKDGRYRDKDGHPAPVVTKDYKVDWAAWQGFRRYHDACHVCHGPNALGSTFAPSLGESLQTMDYETFYGVVVGGRVADRGGTKYVMPAFGEDRNIMCYLDDIYTYIKARSINMASEGKDGLAAGRPNGREDISPEAKKAAAACEDTK